jgi:hypothetical protein
MIALAGCGTRGNVTRLRIEGTVSLSGGEKLNGSITFVPAEGLSGPAATTAIVDGKYRFAETNGPTSGPHRVIVRRIDSKGRFPESRGNSPKTDAKSVTNPVGKVEWTFACDLKATDSGPRNFILDAE